VLVAVLVGKRFGSASPLREIRSARDSRAVRWGHGENSVTYVAAQLVAQRLGVKTQTLGKWRRLGRGPTRADAPATRSCCFCRFRQSTRRGSSAPHPRLGQENELRRRKHSAAWPIRRPRACVAEATTASREAAAGGPKDRYAKPTCSGREGEGARRGANAIRARTKRTGSRHMISAVPWRAAAMHHRRSKTRRKKGCGLCKPHKRDGNSRKADRHRDTRERVIVSEAVS
jgi:hypothetical protein